MKCRANSKTATAQNLIDCTLYAGVIAYAEVYGKKRQAIKNIINDVLLVNDEYYNRFEQYGYDEALRREVYSYRLDIDAEALNKSLFNYINSGQIVYMMNCFIIVLYKKKQGKEKIEQFAKRYIDTISGYKKLTSNVAKELHRKILEEYRLDIR